MTLPGIVSEKMIKDLNSDYMKVEAMEPFTTTLPLLNIRMNFTRIGTYS